MKFNKTILCTVIAQGFLSDATFAASPQLRGRKAASGPVAISDVHVELKVPESIGQHVPRPPLYFSENSVALKAPVHTKNSQDRDRFLEQAQETPPKTVTIINDCEQDITNFRVRYNAEWIPTSDTQYTLISDSMGDVAIDRGESVTLQDVTGDDIHFYALRVEYDFDADQWDVTEVATTSNESDVWTHVTFNDPFGTSLQFPWYMEGIGDDLMVRLCGVSEEEPETTTIATTTTTTTTPAITTTTTPTTTTTTTTPINITTPSTTTPNTTTTTTATPTTTTTPATTTTPSTTTPTTTTMPSTTTTSTTTTTASDSPTTTTTRTRTRTTTEAAPTTDPPSDDDTLTIVNDCGTDITHFAGYYDVRVVRDPVTRRFGVRSESTGNVPIGSGDSVTVDGFVGDEIHFYALSAVYDFRLRDHLVTQVATSPVRSRTYTRVTFTTGAGTELVFPMYVKEIGEDKVFLLCGPDSN